MSCLEENEMEGEELTLKCQVHENKRMKIVSGADFIEKAPEGGCDNLCDFRLACGHACTLSCHPYNREHKNFKCNKDCPKQCANGHRCPRKCYEDCGPCLVLVRKQIPSCKHYVLMPCSKDPAEADCNEPCPYPLNCGHQCQEKCGKKCSPCSVKIKSLALCGHMVEIVCSKSKDEWEQLRVCEWPCNKELDCGHLCKGSCSSCVQFRLHMPCDERCSRILVCGHECQFPCAKSCPPCQQKCENRCMHSRCSALCGEKCSQCNEKCKWRCQHFQCTQICSDNCDRPPCDEPCQKRLKCGHQCIGLCGERCPRLCRVCDESEVTEIFFGTEDEPDARFVRLSDCCHTFEVSGLTQYMETENTDNKEVQMKSCPRCKTVIRTSSRFGNVIKSCLQQIEMVKEKVFGSPDQNEEKRRKLLETAKLFDDDELIGKTKSSLRRLKDLSDRRNDVTVIDSVMLRIRLQLEQAESCHFQSLTQVENYLIFLADIVKICEGFSQKYETIQNCKHTVGTMIWDFFSETIQGVLKVMDENKSPTEQLLYDINREIRRLMTFDRLFQLITKTCHTTNKSEEFLKFYKKAECKLMTFGPLTDDDIEAARSYIVEASKHIDGTVLGISDEERRTIVKAMGLSQGHWFTCPNGHVYCITECGGAMVEGQCNECRATIGGRNHTLRQDNRLASAMDNARHPAWSDRANMFNYDLLQDL